MPSPIPTYSPEMGENKNPPAWISYPLFSFTFTSRWEGIVGSTSSSDLNMCLILILGDNKPHGLALIVHGVQEGKANYRKECTILGGISKVLSPLPMYKNAYEKVFKDTDHCNGSGHLWGEEWGRGECIHVCHGLLTVLVFLVLWIFQCFHMFFPF